MGRPFHASLATEAQRKHLKPRLQGKVDGLCAIYSVLNACKYLLARNDDEDERLFRHLCQKHEKMFPGIVCDGVGVPQLLQIFRTAAAYFEKRQVRLGYNSRLKQPAFGRIPDYFACLRDGLEAAGDGEGRVWIVGLNKTWDHWTVVRQVGDGSVAFFDSYEMQRQRFANFTFNRSNAGDKPGQKILIDQHQSFLIEARPLSKDARRGRRRA